jgi:hypothetical protein
VRCTKMDEPMKIKFQGREFLLIGNLEEGGAIATQEQFDNFEVSYAHLLPNGTIARFGNKIGTREDIEVLSPREVEYRDITYKLLS